MTLDRPDARRAELGQATVSARFAARVWARARRVWDGGGPAVMRGMSRTAGTPGRW